MIETIKQLKAGLTHAAEKAANISPYPFVKKFWPGFNDLDPKMKMGLITTELSGEFAMATLACYGSVVMATPSTSEGPSTLNPKITKENYDTEVKSGQINPYLQETSKKLLTEIIPQLGAGAANLESFGFMSTVKVDTSGKVTTDRYSFDFNDQIQGVDGKNKDYLVHNSFISINNKDNSSDLYLYTQLVDAEGKVGSYGFVDAEGKQHVVPNLSKVVTYPDESNPKNAIVYTIVDGYAYPLLQVENAYDETGAYVGGKIVGFNHVTGERNEPVLDNLIGAVGIANVTADSQGNLISVLGTFGDPTIKAPPTPEFIDIKYVSSVQSSGSEIIVTPTGIVPSAPEAAPVLTLDKPMTTMISDADLGDPSKWFDLDKMPTVTMEDIESGALAATIDAYWRLDRSLYNADGTVILPPGVQPIKPDQWQLVTGKTAPFTDLIFVDWENSSMGTSTYNSQSYPIRRSFENFKIPDEFGNINKFSRAMKVYFYDSQGGLHLGAMLAGFDLDHVNLSGNAESMGDINHINASVGPGASLPKIILGRINGSKEFDFIENFVNMDKFLTEPMQVKREQMMIDIKNGEFDPADLGKVLVIVAPFQPSN